MIWLTLHQLSLSWLKNKNSFLWLCELFLFFLVNYLLSAHSVLGLGLALLEFTRNWPIRYWVHMQLRGLLHMSSASLQCSVVLSGVLCLAAIKANRNNAKWVGIPLDCFAEQNLEGSYLFTPLCYIFPKAQSNQQLPVITMPWGYDWPREVLPGYIRTSEKKIMAIAKIGKEEIGKDNIFYTTATCQVKVSFGRT